MIPSRWCDRSPWVEAYRRGRVESQDRFRRADRPQCTVARCSDQDRQVVVRLHPTHRVTNRVQDVASLTPCVRAGSPVEAPHYVEPAVPDEMADAIRDVIAHAGP
jgi:hypothetical protein